jgi:hypothetical protein
MRILPLALLGACASTPTPVPSGGPRGLRASDHLQVAEVHDELSHQRPVWASTMPESPTTPWLRSWDTHADQTRLAQAHRSEAAALHAAYEQACGDRPLAEVSVSPLRRYAIGGWPTTTGMIIYLDPAAGPPDRLLADIKCHRAWMMLAPTDMEDCPLDLPDIAIDARGDDAAITVSIIVRDPMLVDELHRRAAHELEVRRASR